MHLWIALTCRAHDHLWPCSTPLTQGEKPSCSFGCGRTQQEEHLKIPNLSLCPASLISAGWLRTYNNLQWILQERRHHCLVNLSHKKAEAVQREIICKQALWHQMTKKDSPSWVTLAFFVIFISISLHRITLVIGSFASCAVNCIRTRHNTIGMGGNRTAHSGNRINKNY